MYRGVRTNQLHHVLHIASSRPWEASCSVCIHPHITFLLVCVGRVVTINFYVRYVNSFSRQSGPITPSTTGDRDRLRVVIATESFLPHINGVTNSVLRVVEHLSAHGYEVSVIAPGPEDKSPKSVAVYRVRAVGMPGYRDVRLTLPSSEIGDYLRRQRPDLVHVAAPFVLGSIVLRQCRKVGIPSVAVYQTDVAGFARDYHLGSLAPLAWRVIARIHSLADLTLAPSTSAIDDLRQNGVEKVELWARGVDAERFNPQHRNEVLRKMFNGHRRTIVGYVGRLAREKHLELLAPLAHDPRFSVVIVGDGPCKSALKRLMPNAYFMGFADGQALSELYASFDIFVHAGLSETFCQSIQEALASGVPVVAPASGGPLDLVADGVNGLLWEPTNPASLVEKVNLLTSDVGLRTRLARHARGSVIERTWSSIMTQLEDHYETVLSRGKSARFPGAA